ncbi:TetR/AcrR family transcriptional regulator [Streptococcus ratti]|uniref:TetR/AcrR family transcriptional regulator n=2 Tax=Streptococcus ratti TaxID=1341 RepID=A0A7X9LD18_STRRT|nr:MULTISPECIES: TetR/AcrR family transcriptional regulator [Streptococcus]VEI60993.1 putative transcriptional regulator [Streptococcus mutans]EJN94727.1 TetR/AcrR family transcriptional regulator [Streptococcus ratti FA-1 = DSM 20564]EMP69961.1 TetR family transcriptional regulator [Streptococcus ratti FA-1 = DSM 20564]NMD48517.1 TetR/AcrR family transcriptional regulator [Streptococcus ratti]QEY06645.1 TetR/AcrR family transcriptional regulator [Streptococcus ratti]
MLTNKKQALKTAACEIFSKKGYKATGISEITKKAGVAAGTFYNYYDSKEAIFLDVYIDENNRVRQAMMDEIDWEGDAVELIGQIFGQSRSLISSNKILTEWYNPAISDELHSYYASEKGKSDNPFHQFLVETFTNRMLAEGYSQEKIQEVLQVYQLFYYMDTHITEKDFSNVSQTIEILATYFVKGLFK